jgi:hypothetical protein
MVVLGYSDSMLAMRRWYNPLATITGLTPLPPVGSAMPYFYATRLAAEFPAALEALLVTLYRENYRKGYLFFNVMLDALDPLTAALDGFTTQEVAIDLFVLDPFERWERHQLARRPIYFDPALV